MAKLIVFSEITFNFLLIIRISDILRTKNLITTAAMTKIVAAFCIWILVWALFPNLTLIPFSFLLFAPTILLFFSPNYLKFVRKRQFRSQLVLLVNNIILNMRAGRSFRPSLQAASQNLSAYMRIKIEKVVELLTVDPQNVAKTTHDPEIETILRCFRIIELDSHQALPRLLQFREKLRLEDRLNKKTKQALGQIKAQAALLSILYVGLLYMAFTRYGEPNIKLIFLSFSLFICGLLTTIWQGRRFKWKV